MPDLQGAHTVRFSLYALHASPVDHACMETILNRWHTTTEISYHTLGNISLREFVLRYRRESVGFHNGRYNEI